MQNTNLSFFLDKYLRERPAFLALLRAKEAWLYQKYLPLNKPVVDLGCGDGFFGQTALGGADYGVDLPDSRIKEVKPGIYKKLIIYDGNNIPLADRTAATVVCNSVLEHAENLDRILNEAYRILKPGGYLIAPVMAKPWEDYLLGVKISGESYKNWMRKKQQHFNLLNGRGWETRFKKAGFKLEEKTGHMNPLMCTWIDLLHYVCLPNLVWYKLTGKWTPVRINLWPTKWLSNLAKENVDPNISGGIFFVWKKTVRSGHS